MSDHRDELLSAHLDGATTPEEGARIAADPALQARLAELRAAAALVAEPVAPVSPEQRDRAVAAALTAMGADVAPVIDLDARRRQRLTIASVAAAVAVVAIVAVGLISRDDRSHTTTSAAGAASASASSSAAERTTAAQAAPAAAGADSAFASSYGLGAFNDTAELAAAARAVVEQAKQSVGAGGTAAAGVPSTTATPVPSRALDACTPDLTGSTVVLLDAQATLDGAPVRAFVVELPDGSDELVIFDESCVVVDRQVL